MGARSLPQASAASDATAARVHIGAQLVERGFAACRSPPLWGPAGQRGGLADTVADAGNDPVDRFPA